jgi:L-lysine exporter family protein LysE/ArgO
MFDALAFASLVTGFALSASLIVAIGAQNTFVLRQGLRREHVAAVVAACALLDVALMSAGVGGLGAAVTTRPGLLRWTAIAGTLALAWYSLAAFHRALRPGSLRAQGGGPPQTLQQVLAQTFSISLFNPHVYLDTVVLVGAVGARQAAGTQAAFLVGASLASVLWFALLGFGARLLAPLFVRPAAWRVLDVLVGLMMASIAWKIGASVWAG